MTLLGWSHIFAKAADNNIHVPRLWKTSIDQIVDGYHKNRMMEAAELQDCSHDSARDRHQAAQVLPA